MYAYPTRHKFRSRVSGQSMHELEWCRNSFSLTDTMCIWQWSLKNISTVIYAWSYKSAVYMHTSTSSKSKIKPNQVVLIVRSIFPLKRLHADTSGRHRRVITLPTARLLPARLIAAAAAASVSPRSTRLVAICSLVGWLGARVLVGRQFIANWLLLLRLFARRRVCVHCWRRQHHNVDRATSVNAQRSRRSSSSLASYVKPAFYDTDIDILATILARMSVSVSWNAAFTVYDREMNDGVATRCIKLFTGFVIRYDAIRNYS